MRKRQKYAMKTMKGKINFTKKSISDLTSGIRTLDLKNREGISFPPPGEGIEKFLSWAESDIRQAMTESGENQKRHATNALANSRKAIAALTEWYMNSNHLIDCKDYPHSSSYDQSNLLMKLNLYDDITSIVLRRAIDLRNKAEHEYVSYNFDEIIDYIELSRQIYKSLTQKKSPAHGPCSFGIIGYSIQYRAETGIHVTFNGFNKVEPFLHIAGHDSKKWLGIIFPNTESEAEAEYTYLSEITTDELLEIYQHANYDLKEEKNGSWISVDNWKLLAKKSGLTLDASV